MLEAGEVPRPLEPFGGFLEVVEVCRGVLEAPGGPWRPLEAAQKMLEALETLWRPPLEAPQKSGGCRGPWRPSPAAGLQKILPGQEDGNSVGVPFSIQIHQWPEGC